MSPRPELPDLTDQWIVITGGNGHLGTSLIAALTRVNANVLIVDKQESVGSNVPVGRSGNKSEIDYYCCDLEKEEQRNSLISYISQSIGRLDSLINNAAFVGDSNLEGWSEPFDEQSLSAWRRAIEVNLTAPFHLSQALSPLLSASQIGTIVNITSIYAHLGPDLRLYEGTEMSNPVAYGVSKAGLTQLTRSLATVLSPSIRVNAIAPGGIFRGQDDAFVRRYIDRTPLKRMASEDDLIWATIFLCTPMSSYMTGQTLTVDGGFGVW